MKTQLIQILDYIIINGKTTNWQNVKESIDILFKDKEKPTPIETLLMILNSAGNNPTEKQIITMVTLAVNIKIDVI